MSASSKLRLGPLPKTETAKLTITISVGLKATLDRYAALHSQTHGEPVDAVSIVPHMLEAFMARDREFQRGSSLRGARRTVAVTHDSISADGSDRSSTV
jgi:hypothetical protein